MTGTDNHALFRAVNEQIRLIADGFGVDEELELFCECTRRDCFAHISVRREEYDAVRRFPNRFLTKPEHAGAAERIVDERSGYAVVVQIGAFVGGKAR